MIPGYRSFELLGRGGRADVHRAWDDDGQRYVAVKVLRPGLRDDREQARFEREAAIHARLAGAGRDLALVPVHRHGTTSTQRPYVILDLYDGSVQDWLDNEGTTFTDAQAVAVLRPVVAAVEGAHAAGVVHGDVKPSNVLLAPGGPGLADFGAEPKVPPGSTLPGEVERLGLRHLAPEVLDGGDPSPAGDVWSLGSTLYAMLAAACAFEPGRRETLAAYRHRVRYDPHPPLMRPLDPGLWEALDAALAKDPGRRPSACELRQRLDAIAAGQPPTRPPTLTRGATAVAPPSDAPLLPGDPVRDPAGDLRPDAELAPFLPSALVAPVPADPTPADPAPAVPPPAPVPEPVVDEPTPPVEEPPPPPNPPPPPPPAPVDDAPPVLPLPGPPPAGPEDADHIAYAEPLVVEPMVEPMVVVGPAPPAVDPYDVHDDTYARYEVGPGPGHDDRHAVPATAPGYDDPQPGHWQELPVDPDYRPRHAPARSFPPWLPPAVATVVLVVVGVVAVLARSGGDDGAGDPGERTEEPGAGGADEADVDLTVPGSVPPVSVDPALAPTDFVAEDFGATVDLTWTDHADGRLTYVVIHRTPGQEQQIDEVVRGSTSHTVRGLDPERPYCFRLLGVGQDLAGELVRASVDTEVRGCEPEAEIEDAGP